MLDQGIAAARFCIAITFNALGLLALLAAAWLMPQFLAVVVKSGLPLFWQ